MNLRCRDGDLAVVVGDFPGCEGNIGRIVQVKGPVRTPKQYPLPCWRIKPINRRGWLIAENDWEVTKEVVIWRSGIIHPDCWLLPIRPTEDGQDVSVVEKFPETSLAIGDSRRLRLSASTNVREDAV